MKFDLNSRQALPAPWEEHESLVRPHSRLWKLTESHVSRTGRFLAAGEGYLYSTDLLLGALCQRSFHLTEGFLHVVRYWNIIVGAMLIRAQLDNLLIAHYLADHVRDPAAFANHVMAGGRVKDLRDEEGKKLFDKRLRELASDAHPWLDTVYEKTSGWVHFSGSHVFSTWRVGGEAEIVGGVPLHPQHVPATLLLEMFGAMIQGTEELFGYLESWAAHKDLQQARSDHRT